MRYLFMLGLVIMFAVGCTDNSLEENEQLRQIENEDYEIPINGIEKEDYEVPPNGVYSKIEKEDYEVPPNG